MGLTENALLGANVGVALCKSDDSDGTAVGWLDNPVGTNVGIAVTRLDAGDGAAVGLTVDATLGTTVGARDE